jgi:aldehyde dehydrogenase (NAD+)
VKESLGDVRGVCATLRYNAGAADKMEGSTIPLGREFVDFTMLQPMGVTAHIVPWNYPLGMVARSLAPALAAGCTAVVKPAEQSPLTALAFAELCHTAGIPKGVVNVVAGFGEDAGAALVSHPLVRGITFTGSVETGRKIYGNAARGLKPAVLELGGKNPLIVFADADLERAAFDALDGAFGNSGQVCSSSSRFLLHRSIREEFLDRLAEGAAKVTVGAGFDNRDLGPLVSKEQHDKVQSYIDAGRRSGAKLRLGGGRPNGLDRGYFVEPTIFDAVDPASPLAREEIFGPVAVALTFDTDDEALRLANGLGFGLVAGVYSQDISRALT